MTPVDRQARGDADTARPMWIDGEAVDGSHGAYAVVNPATEAVIGYAPEASDADTDAAVAAARRAQPHWAATPMEERAARLRALAAALRAREDELLPLIMAETGATIAVGSRLQLPVCADRLERAAVGLVGGDTVAAPPSIMPTTPLAPGGLVNGVAVREPVGVVACITPYNFPLANVGNKIGPALATGNAVIIKPAPQDPLATLELGRLAQEVGFPPGVFNVVTGSRPDLGRALVRSRDVDMVSFTGSTAVGVSIYESAAATMKRLFLELGGKGAAIVFGDADLDLAVQGIGTVWTFHSGQICTAPTRVLAHRSVYDELVTRLSALADGLRVGDPTEPETVVGPVISAAHRDRITGSGRRGLDVGAGQAAGARAVDVDRGFYVAPTLLADCTAEMRVVREEIFGPVVAVVPFDEDEEAVAIANQSQYGLYDYVYTGDTARGYHVARRLASGCVGLNTVQRHHGVPFGGTKMSGLGRENAEYGMHSYTELKSIVWTS